MSREKSKSFKSFLVRDGYLFVFTILCVLGLLSYFLASKEFSPELERTVLGTSALRGVWLTNSSGLECPEMAGLGVDGCIDDTYFEDFNEIDAQTVNFDNEGRVVYSNDEIFVSGIFDVERTLNNDVWTDVYMGDLNLKINSRQWVFEDVVWNKAESPILDIVPSDTGYYVIFYPSITLTSRSKQFWVFEYVSEDDIVRSLSFKGTDGERAFIETTYVSVLKYGDDIYFKFERLDPSLMSNREVNLYRFDGDLELFRSFLLLVE